MLDEWSHTFEEPLQVKATVSTLNTWVRANVDNQALPRSAWQDLAAIRGRTQRVCIPHDNGPGREIVYPSSLLPDMVEYISYATTDVLQAEEHIALTCPAVLETSSTALRYVLWQRTSVLIAPTSRRTTYPDPHDYQQTRPNQRAPLIADDFLLCLRKLVAWLEDRGVSQVPYSTLKDQYTHKLICIE